MEWDERFSREHPLKIRDSDLFLHGTSSRNYSDIQRTGFLLRKAPNRNWGISERGICFEKYVKQGQYCGDSSARFVYDFIEHYCEVACEHDGSSEGVILRVKGRELKELGCPIYADWNNHYPLKRNAEGIPIGIDSDASVLSIIVVDCDIPLRYLEVVKRISFKG